jgi:SAM-dependent methyltransferase
VIGARAEWYRAVYDQLADSYDFDESAFPFYLNEQRAILRLLEQYIPPVEAGQGRVALDLGCGPGQYTEWLLKRGYDVVAVDLSPKMVEATRRLTAPYAERITLVEGDFLQVQLPLGSFQIILALGGVLNHLDAWSSFFTRAADLLSSGGLMLFNMDNIVGLHQFCYAVYSHAYQAPLRPHWSDLPKRIWASLTGQEYQTWLPIETSDGVVRFPFTYGSRRLTRRLLEAAGLRVVDERGTNALAGLVPSTSLSVSYRTRADQAQPARLGQWLEALDRQLARPLVGLAGIQFTLARKESLAGLS